jgi:DNA-directed RNA polymerase subunit omega
MARITIEDCMEQVPNRFHLVRMASIRAKQLKKGARALVAEENKEVVTSLREIAAGLVKPGDVEASTEASLAETSLDAESQPAEVVETAPADPETPPED